MKKPKAPKGPETYVCALCRQEFAFREGEYERVLVERGNLYGEAMDDDGYVCNGCWQAVDPLIRKWAPALFMIQERYRLQPGHVDTP